MCLRRWWPSLAANADPRHPLIHPVLNLCRTHASTLVDYADCQPGEDEFPFTKTSSPFGSDSCMPTEWGMNPPLPKS